MESFGLVFPKGCLLEEQHWRLELIQLCYLTIDDFGERLPLWISFRGGASWTLTLGNCRTAVPMRFEQLTRESDVLFFTGVKGTSMFKLLFDFLQRKAMAMTYWDGSKKTLLSQEKPSTSELNESLLQSPEFTGCDPNLLSPLKPGPSRKLSLEQEL